MNSLARIFEIPIRWSRSPLFWILCAAAVMRAVGITWGLPAADGWDDDGVAPRNFLVGIIQTYSPGSHFTYPPLHMLLLAVLTAPGWIIAISQAPSLHTHDVIAQIIHVPYMTFFAVVARVVSVAFSLGTIFVIGKIAEGIGGRRAGVFAAAACALNGALVYYGQVTNLDGPALFWAALSIWGWSRTIAEHEPRHIRWAAFAAAAAVATKDQAYAIFLISVPLALMAWIALDRWPRQNFRRILMVAVVWCTFALLVLLLLDGALTNPHGFADRIALLSGSASRDYAEYQDNWTGRLYVLKDMWANAPRYYPTFALLPAGFGILTLVLRETGSRLIAGLLPFLAAVSFTLAFNFIALRTEPRFVLPQFVFIAVYIGIAVDKLAFASRFWMRAAGRALCLAAACYALYLCAGMSTAFIADPRYDAERWMKEHVRQGDTVEIYGLNAYLPRFPDGAVVSRVGSKPLSARNPLPHVTEVKQSYREIAVRRPRFLLVPGYWVRDYLEAAGTYGGRAVPKVRLIAHEDVEARHYFEALFGRRLPYKLAHESRYTASLGPPENAYESLGQTVYIFELDRAKAFVPIVTGQEPAAIGWPQPPFCRV